jgi:hypothetical protein
MQARQYLEEEEEKDDEEEEEEEERERKKRAQWTVRFVSLLSCMRVRPCQVLHLIRLALTDFFLQFLVELPLFFVFVFSSSMQFPFASPASCASVASRAASTEADEFAFFGSVFVQRKSSSMFRLEVLHP